MPTLKIKNNGVWEKVSGGSSASGGGIDLPSGGTPGQVLTMGEDGKPMWADSVGDVNLPVAEGVLFG